MITRLPVILVIAAPAVSLISQPNSLSEEQRWHRRIGEYFAEHGYAFVAVDVRGRGDSEGLFVPYRNEGRDGYDTIEWCAGQPWSTGKVARSADPTMERINGSQPSSNHRI